MYGGPGPIDRQFDRPVLQVLQTKFSSCQAVCLFFKASILFLLPDRGDELEISLEELQGDFERAWAFQQGIVIQVCCCQLIDFHLPDIKLSWFHYTGALDDVNWQIHTPVSGYCCYSLFNPLETLRKVPLGNGIGHAAATQERVLFMNDHRAAFPIALSYNSHSRRHSIWTLPKIATEDVFSIADLDDLPKMSIDTDSVNVATLQDNLARAVAREMKPKVTLELLWTDQDILLEYLL